jgi:hypothetical protein
VLVSGNDVLISILSKILSSLLLRASGDIAYNLPFTQIKAGLGALDTIPAWGIVQIIGFIGLLELGIYQHYL